MYIVWSSELREVFSQNFSEIKSENLRAYTSQYSLPIDQIWLYSEYPSKK